MDFWDVIASTVLGGVQTGLGVLTGSMNADATKQVGADQAAAIRYQADQNVAMQRETNAMQVDLANNAVQRRQADLAKAGINPLMAGGQGGAQTPTLQAPQLSGLGEAARVSSPGQATLAAIQGFQQGTQMAQNAMSNAMSLVQQNAEADKARADATNAIAEASLKNTQNDWWAETSKSTIALQGEQGQAAAAQAKLNEANAATVEAMRAPEVAKVIQDTATSLTQAIKNGAETALTDQKNHTEAALTQTANSIAQYAQETYKAKASEAVTIAKTLAYKLLNEVPTEVSQNIDIRDMTLRIMQNENTKLILDNILKNDYGRPVEWAKIPLAQQLGIAATTGGKVLSNPINKVMPAMPEGR